MNGKLCLIFAPLYEKANVKKKREKKTGKQS
jgi:hypothetical protein